MKNTFKKYVFLLQMLILQSLFSSNNLVAQCCGGSSSSSGNSTITTTKHSASNGNGWWHNKSSTTTKNDNSSGGGGSGDEGDDDYGDDDGGYDDDDLGFGGDFYHDFDDFWNNNSGGGNVLQCPVQLRSQTTATTPFDRQRTTIGIGEEVTVTVEGLCNGTNVKLNLANMGADGNVITSLPFKFNAGFTPGKIIITATFSNKTKDCSVCQNMELTFDVIAPSNIVYVKTLQLTNNKVKHISKMPSAGYAAKVLLEPATVNFSNVEIKEGAANAVPVDDSGTYLFDLQNILIALGRNFPTHPETINWAKCETDVIVGKGTPLFGDDVITLGLVCEQILSPLNSAFNISWKYDIFYRRIGAPNSEKIKFATKTQKAVQLSNPTNPYFYLYKSTANDYTKLLDPDYLPWSPSCP